MFHSSTAERKLRRSLQLAPFVICRLSEQRDRPAVDRTFRVRRVLDRSVLRATHAKGEREGEDLRQRSTPLEASLPIYVKA